MVSDTIFKAKNQVTKKLLSDARWLYNPASQEATRFESNDLLKRGLESALLQIAEIVYKGKEKYRIKLSSFTFTCAILWQMQ